MANQTRPAGVQSVAKALEILEIIGSDPAETALSEIAAASGLPVPTIHRLVRTLLDSGYLRQLPNRRYTLGPRLIPLGQAADAVFGTWSRPILAGLVDALGETANLAVLDGNMITYVGQVPSPHSMRMFTEVGRRVLPHCTGVGKALMAQLEDDEVRTILSRTGMPAMTPATISDPETMVTALQVVRRQGYAIDDGEQELGVHCIAVPVPSDSTLMAVSVSGPAPRMSKDLLQRAIPLLKSASISLSTELDLRNSA